jgi:hypothetical protein
MAPDVMAAPFYLDSQQAVLRMENQKINFTGKCTRRPAACHIPQPGDAVDDYKVVGKLFLEYPVEIVLRSASGQRRPIRWNQPSHNAYILIQQHSAGWLGSQLLAVEGEQQNEMNVIHIVAQRVRDYSRWLCELGVTSRDFH